MFLPKPARWLYRKSYYNILTLIRFTDSGNTSCNTLIQDQRDFNIQPYCDKYFHNGGLHYF